MNEQVINSLRIFTQIQTPAILKKKKKTRIHTPTALLHKMPAIWYIEYKKKAPAENSTWSMSAILAHGYCA